MIPTILGRTDTKNPRPSAWRGFTLIELVVVMGIMLSLSLVVVGSYVGMTRAIAAQAGINALRNAVLLTRQHACMDGQRTYLFVLDGTNYVLSRRVGVVHDSAAGSFTDLYTDLSGFTTVSGVSTNTAEGLKLYNLSKGSTDSTPYVVVKKIQREGLMAAWTVFFDPATPGFFKKDNHYGIEVYPVRSLPKGYRFVPASGDPNDADPKFGYSLYFEPSGAPGGTLTLEIYEAIKTDIIQSVTVEAGSGKIEVKTETP